MGDRSKIEWTDATWNPVTGCSPVSEGCKHCYAKRNAQGRLRGRVGYDREDPFRVKVHAGRMGQPLRWVKPRRIFVCSMGDLFHEDVPEETLAEIFQNMAWAHEHTFMVLTKRPERMKRLLTDDDFISSVVDNGGECADWPWPLKNVWLGVTAENQTRADERIPVLMETPSAIRFVSVEPMLGPVNPALALDWVICGGETGPGARPLHPDWVRGLRDQCVSARVPFFFKSWGEWFVPEDGARACRVCGCTENNGCDEGCWWVERALCSSCVGKEVPKGDRPVKFRKVGKKSAGRFLDGKEWDEIPEGRRREGA
jgi:protein gp37